MKLLITLIASIILSTSAFAEVNTSETIKTPALSCASIPSDREDLFDRCIEGTMNEGDLLDLHIFQHMADQKAEFKYYPQLG